MGNQPPAPPVTEEPKETSLLKNIPTKERLVLVLGAPGSGKGTQCKLIAAYTGMLHLSTGDLCREEISLGTPIGLRIKKYVDARELVPDFLVVDIIVSRLLQGNTYQGVLLDGFPRTPEQARTLLINGNLNIERVLLLEAEDEICVARMMQRNRDEADGDEEAIRRRLSVFHDNKEKVLKFFKNKIQRVNGERTTEEVYSTLATLLCSPVAPTSIVPEDDGGWGDADALEAAQKEIPTHFTISVNPVDFVPLTGGRSQVAITVTPPDSMDRVPVDVCCVVDISGSMNAEAMFQDPDDDTRHIGSGFTQLDLVKHAVKTIINTLTEHDRLSLVAFHTVAEVFLDLTPMTEEGIIIASTFLESMHCNGTTNLWAGLEEGLETLRRETSHRLPDGRNRQCSVFLLTDGIPDAHPSSLPEQQLLKNYFDKHPDFVCQVNTFGFGYDLLSNMLFDLSCRGRGTFGFIPDAKIVGTCFVNTIANACSMLAEDCVVKIKLKNGAKLAKLLPGSSSATEGTIELGHLQFGQARDTIVYVDFPAGSPGDEYMEVTVEYTDHIRGRGVIIPEIATSRLATPDARISRVRHHILDTIANLITDYEAHPASYIASTARLVEELDKYVVGSEEDDARLKAFYEDVSGRITKAISTHERYKRWGQHYLRAILRAHQLQLRTNFMDPGLQIYGGKLFQKLQERGGEIFVALPMTPSRPPPPTNNAYVPSVAAAAAPDVPVIDNNLYYAGGGGGCFDGSCFVAIKKKEGEEKLQLCEVRKGDLVKVLGGEKEGGVGWSRVDCIVKIEREEGSSPLVEFSESGLKITEKHPIRFQNDLLWKHPKDCKNTFRSSSASSPFVYNFVLSEKKGNCCNGRVLFVNGVQCVTFGHGLDSDEVVSNSFYGSSRVLDVLSGLPGFEDGFVSVRGSLKQFEKSV